jgi:uncharacterized protein
MKQSFMALSKKSWASFFVGFVFAIGLVVSGMTQPHKIIQFLDIGGSWDYSLIFVMIGAIAVHAIAYPLVRRRESPLFETKWHVPTRKDITPSLVVGSTLFGMGWGLGGFCPGPAITSLSSGNAQSFIFVGSMLSGMVLFKISDKYILSQNLLGQIRKLVRKWKQSDISQAS